MLLTTYLVLCPVSHIVEKIWLASYIAVGDLAMSKPHLSIFTGKPTHAHPLDVTCIECGRVSRAYTREKAEKQVEESNDWINSLPASEQSRHTRASLNMYVCLGCGGTEFRKSENGDCPDGVTLPPVIYTP